MKFQDSPTVNKHNTLSDGFSSILKESYDYFAEQGINVMSDIQDILTEDTLFENYATKLCEALDVEDASQLNQLLENARVNMLQESSISGVSPLAGLTMPTIRKLWLKIAMKNAIPTEAAKIPTFTISYFKPYITEEDGTKRYLPDSLRDPASRGNVAAKKALFADYIMAPVTGKVTAANVTKSGNTVTAVAAVTGDDNVDKINVDIITLSCGTTHTETIDPIFYIDGAIISDGKGTPSYAEVATSIKLSHESKLYGTVSATIDNVVYTDTILGSVNLVDGTIEIASLKGLVKAVKIKGYLSSETNWHSQSVGFEIDRKNITIGTGAHINGSLPIELVQDTMALYNVDATLEVVDTMSNVVAQKLEYEIVDFFNNSFENMANKTDLVGSFDVIPPVGFAGSPLMWREEIKRIIDYKATQLKDFSAFTNGYFVIFGHPLDMQIIPNVQWTFNHTTDEKGGVVVDYDIGAYSGAHKYNLVSTFHATQGQINIFFVPESDKYMTYKYYPYAFNIEKGYLNPQNPNVPSIMMTKRHTIEEFMPVQAVVEIHNNRAEVIEAYDVH